MDLNIRIYAIMFAEWIRDNTVSDGAPKLLYRETGERKTIPELYEIFLLFLK